MKTIQTRNAIYKLEDLTDLPYAHISHKGKAGLKLIAKHRNKDNITLSLSPLVDYTNIVKGTRSSVLVN